MSLIDDKNKVLENRESDNRIKLGNDDDTSVVDDTPVDNTELKEKDRRQEKEMIEKAIAFWNHPALRDLSSEEKRAYLEEHQGLTKAQIHKVWEKTVAATGTGVDNYFVDHHDAISNGGNVVTQQTNCDRHQFNHQSSSRLSTNANHGKIFNLNEVPYNKSSAADYGNDYNNHSIIGQRHPRLPPLTNNLSTMEEGDGSISIARGLSLMGLGSFLGITGAAAVRWLNGGRFELLPSTDTRPNTYNSHTISTSESSRLITSFPSDNRRRQLQAFSSDQEYQHREEHHMDIEDTDDGSMQSNNDRHSENEDGEDQYDDGENSDKDAALMMEECLLDRMDGLLSSINSNSALQERLLVKLANTSTITDDSMSLLKQNSLGVTSINHNNNNNNNTESSSKTSDCNTRLSSQMKEIKDDLTKILENMASNATSKNADQNQNEEHYEEHYEERLTDLLSKIENCIKTISNPDDASFVTDFGVTAIASMSASRNTAAENTSTSQWQHDTPPVRTTPATLAADMNNKSQVVCSATTSTNIPLSLKDCILKIAENNNDVTLKMGSQLLYLYLANLSGKPDNQRYRKIYTSNESFQKVENVIGGKDLLHAVGFEEESEKGILEWVPTGSTEKEICALVLVKEAAAALGIMRKSNNFSSSELARLALSKLSSLSSSVSNQARLLSKKLGESDSNDNSEIDNHPHHSEFDIPQTPTNCSLQSPPMPKKIPFVPTPSEAGNS